MITKDDVRTLNDVIEIINSKCDNSTVAIKGSVECLESLLMVLRKVDQFMLRKRLDDLQGNASKKDLLLKNISKRREKELSYSHTYDEMVEIYQVVFGHAPLDDSRKSDLVKAVYNRASAEYPENVREVYGVV